MPHPAPLQRQPRRRGRLAVPRLTALALLLAGLAGAQAQTWTGLGFANNWSEQNNWEARLRPVSSPSTAITFAGSLKLSTVQNLAAPFTLNTLTFASNAGAFSLSGNALRFDGSNAGLVQNSSSGVLIANGLQLATSLLVDGPGNLTLTGNLARAASTSRDTLALTKRGTGTLTLASANSFDASVRIEAGQVLLRDSAALRDANVALAIDNGLSFGSLAQATLGGLSGSGALALGTATLTLAGADTTGLYSGNITGSTGSVTKTGNGVATWNGHSRFDNLQVAGGALVLAGGSLALTTKELGLQVGGGTLASPAAELTIRGGAVVSATGSTVLVDGNGQSVLRITGAGSRLATNTTTRVGNQAAGAVDVSSGGTLDAGAALTVGFANGSSGALSVFSGGTVTSNVGTLGLLTGASGRADVGTGGRWTTAWLNIGGTDEDMRGGTGMLAITAGGQVQVRDVLNFWSADAQVLVDGGSLRAGFLNSLGATGAITLRADPAGGGAALLLDGAIDGSFAGSLSGAGSLLKTGGGRQALLGPNPGFSGSTTIRGGQIVLGHQDALRGSQVRIEVANGLDVNGLAGVVVGSLAGSGALALGNTQLTLGEDNLDTAYSGVLSGSRGAWLVKKGTGTLTLSGTGSTANRLVVEGGGAVMVDGGTLALSAESFNNAALVLNAGGRLALRNGAQLAVNGGGVSSVFLGGDSGTELVIEGARSRMDAGYQTLVGTGGQGRMAVRDGGSFTGQLILAAGAYGGTGTVSFESGAQGNVPLVALGLIGGSTGTLLVSGAGTLLRVPIQLGLGGLNFAERGSTGRLEITDGATVSAGNLQFLTAGSSARVDGGSLRVEGLSSLSGEGQITLVADPGGSGRALTMGGLMGDYNYSGSIDGDGGLLKTSFSSQALSGRNSFTGMVRVQNGVLQMTTSRASEYEVSGQGVLRLGERNLGVAVVQAGFGGQIVYTGSTLNGGQLTGIGSHDISAVRRLVGTRVGGGAALAPASGTTFSGVVNDGIVDNLPGRTLTWISGSNPNGQVLVGGTTAISNFSSGGQLQVGAGGTLVSIAGNLVLGGGSRTTVGAVDTPGGTVELQAGGRLQVNGGLLVNNGRILGPVEVNFGGLAKGAGSYGAVAVNDGGRFSPGNSPGSVTTGDAVWGAGGSLLVELARADGTAGTDWDLWTVHGGLTIGAGTTANSRFTVSLATLDASNAAAPLAGFDAQRSWRWRIVDTDTGITGFDPARVALDTQGFLSPLAGGTLRLAVQDGDLFLQFNPLPVPEPQTWALLLGGLGMVGWAARRRRAG